MNALRPFLVASAVALLLGAPASAREEFELRRALAVEAVAPGEAFELTVERSWSPEFVPAPFVDADLAALHAVLIDAQHVEEPGRITERRVYRCRVVSLDDAPLPERQARAHAVDGDRTVVAVAPALVIPVRPVLDPDQPGAVEWPDGLLPAPVVDRGAWWLGAATGVGVLFLGFLLRHRWNARRRHAQAGVDERSRARDRLRELARGAATDSIVRDYHEVAAILRDYLADGAAIPARESTTEQILEFAGHTARIAPAQTAALDRVLHECDRVKFARRQPRAEERQDLFRQAELFLEPDGAAS